VNSDKSVKDLYNIVQKKFGEINSLVFAAGITTNKKHIEDFDEKIWNEVIDTNVTGLLRVLKHFFPSLMKTKGRIAVVNSIASKKSSPFSGFEYTISKAALSGLVKQLAVEWAKYNIYINSVFPSMTLTPMLKKNLDNNEIKTLQEKLPLKKFSDPLDTARAIEFLISKKNKYITGSGIDVSGGQFLSG
jgi:3-oxoacyl-[acyl-carrier protein] reductase